MQEGSASSNKNSGTLRRAGRSITRNNLFKLIDSIVRDHAMKDDSGHLKIPFTSTYLQNLFKGFDLSGDGFKFGDENMIESVPDLKFHPYDKYPDLYSEEMPVVVISYTWKMCLLTELPFFILKFEQMIGESNMSYWMDIFMNDQNSENIQLELDNADYFYCNAKFHAVFLAHRTLSRIWINHEISGRLNSAKIKENYTNDELIEAVRRGFNPNLPILVFDSKITHVHDDLENFSSDRFDCMEAFDPNDKKLIQVKILQNFSSKQNFNSMMSDYTLAALAQYRKEQVMNRILSIVFLLAASPIFGPVPTMYILFKHTRVASAVKGCFGKQGDKRAGNFLPPLHDAIQIPWTIFHIIVKTFCQLTWLELTSFLIFYSSYFVLFVFWANKLAMSNNEGFKVSCAGLWEYNVASIVLRNFVPYVVIFIISELESRRIISMILGTSQSVALNTVTQTTAPIFVAMTLIAISDTCSTAVWSRNPHCSSTGTVDGVSTQSPSPSSSPSFSLIGVGWINVGLDVCSILAMLLWIIMARRQLQFRQSSLVPPGAGGTPAPASGGEN